MLSGWEADNFVVVKWLQALKRIAMLCEPWKGPISIHVIELRQFVTCIAHREDRAPCHFRPALEEGLAARV